MIRVMVRWWQRLRSGRGGLRGYQRGQSLIIVTFAFIGILAFVGLAVDLGWVYVERVRVAQAADAAALAGASELPLEGPAYRRALVYLQENGYDYEAGDVQVFYNQPSRLPDDDRYITTIWIDTAEALDTSDRVRVRVRRQVFMTFMQFIGFKYVPVEATAMAENISNVDTVIVYDRSGSMQFDTLCFGCWEPAADAPYPSGIIYPLPWSVTPSDLPTHCSNEDRYYKTGDPGDVQTGEISIVIEAEEYSSLSVDYHLSYTRAITTPYQTYWVLQRSNYNEYHDAAVGAMGRDERGAYISHHPFADYDSYTAGLGVPCTWEDLVNGEKCRRDGLPEDAEGPFPAPRADYEFIAPRADNYYVWVRGQGGVRVRAESRNQHIFWGMDGNPRGQEDGFPAGVAYDGAVDYAWDWRRLSRGEQGGGGDAVYLVTGTHTLHLWAGGAGFDVDRIIITTERRDPLPAEIRNQSPNNGRTGSACDPCDPRFAGRPGGYQGPDYYRPQCPIDRREDPIYDDMQPMRGALEAAKYFVGMLDPRLDQVGYVPYSDEAEIRNELECLRRLGADLCTWQVITDTVLYELERTRTDDRTNIAEGIKRGIEVLDTQDGHYGRPAAAHIMVLLTDGEANVVPEDDDCGGPKDCVRHYAGEALGENIIIYTISLGRSADQQLMREVAIKTQGDHYHAPTTDQLEDIFDAIIERIFLRLIR